MKVANISPERIRELSESIRVKLARTVKEIDGINLQIRLLSVNAQIEAARAGEAGRSFAVVASSMGDLAGRTARAADGLAQALKQDIDEMASISERLGTDVRGARLSDLALNNIDLIDRNLYERSCDVRWWATDTSLVDACRAPGDPHATRYAARRLGVILDAYTVYLDLVLCDWQGTVIANGRPHAFASQGADVSQAPWFQSALATPDGSAFGFQPLHASPLVNGQRVLVYACKVHEDGEVAHPAIGVLGILFNWDSLAQTIVHNTPLSEREKAVTRVLIVDQCGQVFADSHDRILQAPFPPAVFEQVTRSDKGFVVTQYDHTPSVIAHAKAPGFETYTTGWHAIIVQALAQR